MIGTRLSHFRIVEKLGEGGMGVVYRAEDERLRRPVALKVLPPDLVANEERRLRFIREARAAAAASHPNIATVYEVDEVDGVVFIAMELVEGKTLRGHMGGRPMPIREALRIVTQIAEALAHAHAARVIHRDLKPENVIVGPDRQVKILDFGLAKLASAPADAEAPGWSEAETLSAEVTRTGKVLGTLAYMSPEQARGQPVDTRTDVFSFGSTLYEMVTAKLPFRGKTSGEIVSAILHDEPAPPSRHNPETSAELERIIGKCLEKDPNERYQDTRDLVVDLRKLRRTTDTGVQVARDSGAPERRRLQTITIAAVAGLAVAVALTGWLLARRTGGSPQLRLRQLTANPAETTVVDAAISPDGKYLAYLDPEGLHLLLAETGEAYPISLPREFRLNRISWYPDSVRLIATGKLASEEKNSLWVFSVMGGTPRRLRDDAWGGVVSPDGSRIAFLKGFWPSREIWVMGASGEDPKRVVQSEERGHLFWAVWSPDGRRIAYGLSPHGTADPGYTIESRDRDGGSRTTLVSLDRLGLNFHGFPRPAWLPDGRLIFCRTEPEPRGNDSNLWEVQVNLRTGRPHGEPRKVSEWADQSVRNLTATADGKRIVFLKVRNQMDVYIGGLREGAKLAEVARRITTDERFDYPESWTSDSRSIFFVSDRRGNLDIFKQLITESTAEPLAAGPTDERSARLSPDGVSLLYWLWPDGADSSSSQTLMQVPVSGGAPREVFRSAGEAELSCSRGRDGACFVGSLQRDDLVLSTFDPRGDKPTEAAKVRVDRARPIFWAISPEGKRVAVANFGNTLRIVTLSGGAEQVLRLEGWSLLANVAWAADGGNLFAQGTPEVSDAPGRTTSILSVDLRGRVHVLLEHPNLWFWYPVPSPDGRSLAYGALDHEGNAWMVEGF